MTPRRRIAVLAAAVVVVAALVVAADLVVRDRVADRIAEAVGDEVGVPVDVALPGPLAGLRALAGQVGEVRLVARQVPVADGEVVVDRLSVVVTDLEVDGADRPVAGEGRFEARLGEAAVVGGAPAELAPLLSLDDGDLRVGVGPVSVPLEVEAAGQALQVSLAGDVPVLDALLGGGLAVPLDLPDGVAVTGAVVEGGELVLTGPLDPVAVSRS